MPTSSNSKPSAARPRILIPLAYYLPGSRAGGPVRSIANLVEALGDEFEFQVIAYNHDLGDSQPYPGIEANRWQRVGKAQVLYLSDDQATPMRLARWIRATSYDALYLNSFFEFRWAIWPLWLMRARWLARKPILLAPRGQFSPGALGLKRAKKRRYTTLYRAAMGARATTFHATTDEEKALILQQLSVDPESVLVAGNLPSQLDLSQSAPPESKRTGCLQIIFLSRLSPMKNLDGALRMLRGVSGEAQFDIYGPREDAPYWERCQELIAALPPTTRVEYRGAVSHEEALEAFASSDLFFFPTLGENFGHAILESLQAGCPVLISDQTPWRDLERQGVGWDLPLDQPERFTAVLQRCVEMGAEEREQLRRQTQEYALRFCLSHPGAEAHRQLFLKALISGD